jgi:hypothetical protein
MIAEEHELPCSSSSSLSKPSVKNHFCLARPLNGDFPCILQYWLCALDRSILGSTSAKMNGELLQELLCGMRSNELTSNGEEGSLHLRHALF